MGESNRWNNYAISTSDLAESLTKSSGSLVAANGTLEEAVALTATANTIIQDADVVGTALKTISMRLRGTSVKEMEEEGLETDGVVTSKSKLQSKIKGLSGVDILTDTGAYKSTYQILSEIADVWGDINDMDQAALLELLAGKRGGSVMAAILQNPETLKDAFESASEASGSALIENEKYMDSIQGRIDQFNNSLQTMWNNELNSDVIKWFVGLGKVLIQTIDLLGLLPSAFIVISLAIMKMNKMNLVEYFGSISNSILNLGAKLKGYATGLIGASTATQALTAEMIQQQVATNAITQMEAIRQATTNGLILSEVALTNAEATHLMTATGLSDVEAQAIANKLGLDTATQKLTLSTLQQAVITGKLTAAEAAHLGIATGLMSASIGLTAAKATQILTSQGVSEAEAQEIVAALGLGIALKPVTAETIALAIANGALTPELGSVALGLLGVGAGAKGATGGLMALWSALWPILAVMAGIAAIYGVVKLFDAMTVSAEEASEQLKETKNTISSLESELDSLDTQLDETRDKIAELTALPSLSLTQQEDLDRLEREVELLERQIALKERQLAMEENKLVEDAEVAIQKKFYDSGAYDLTNDGEIQKDRWFTWGNSGEDVITRAIEQYETNDKAKKVLEDALLDDWDNKTDAERSEFIREVKQGKYGLEQSDFLFNSAWDSEDIQERLDELDEKNINIASSIEDFFNDPDYAGLEYGMSDEIDAFLDDFNNAQLKWEKALYGDASKVNAIESLWGPNATEEMKALKSEIDKIMATDDDWDKKNVAIKNIIPTKEGIEGYQQLDWVMKELGVTTQDIADYFTILNGEFNSNTIEGVLGQYQTGVDVLERMKSSTNFEKDWGEFFDKDDEGKFKVRADKFAEILEGMDADTQKTFARVVESAVNGAEDLSKIDWDKAIASFNLSGIASITKIMEQQWSEINKNIFKSIDDDKISGWIDTFSELSAALEDVAGSMDLLHAAQTQMINSGRISIKTALEIIESTDRWNEMLTITEGTIKLNANAEDVLVQSKLNVIQAQIEEALGAAQLQLQQLGAAESTLAAASAADVTDEAYLIYTDAMNTYTAVIAGFGAAISALLEGRFGDIIPNMRTAYSTAKKVSDASRDKSEVSRAEVQERIRNLQAQKNMLEQVDTTSEFKNNYDYDKTPGDKYDDDDDERLEKIQKYYERQIKNLEGQQTYLENEIERTEALNHSASVDYYKEQIALEDQKLDVLEQEREALLKLEMNDDVADALWEVEHALQESTIAAINFGKAMHEAQIEAIDGISEAYDAMDTISDNRMQNLELYKDNLEINGKYASEGLYNEMIRLAEEDVARDEQKLDDLLWAIDEYRNMENPFDIGTDEYAGFEADRDKNLVELHAQAAETKNNIREGINVVDQLREDIKDTYIEAWDGITEAFDNIDSFLQNQLDFIDAYEERLDTLNINVPDSVYEVKIDTQKDIIANLSKGLTEDKRLLDEYASKYGTDDKRYVEKLEEVTQKESQLYQEETKVLELKQQIFDNQIDRFNQVVDRINDATQRLQNLSDLLADEDVATENGEWTDEGLTRLGTAYQQMAYYKQSSEEIAEKMEEVEKAYKRGEISEKKYYETMQELSDQQWDAINSYKDMKDGIVELEEARIDMIEEGLNKEAEAYQELIDLKKEELDAERDLYDFKKNIEKQTKDIAALERRIASMSGSTDASTIAERIKLEAELRNAKDELDGSYRDHAYDSISNDLDDEMEAYSKSSENYIKSLRESIKDTNLLIEQTYQKVLENTDIILQTITSKADEYGFYIDEELTTPWENARTEALNLEVSAISHINNIYNKVDSVTSTMTANVTQPWQDGKRDLLSFSEEVPKQLQKMLEDAQLKQQDMSDALSQPWLDAQGVIDQMPNYADSAAQEMLRIAKQNVTDINSEYAKISYPSYSGGDTNTGGTGNTSNPGGVVPNPPGNTYKSGPGVANLQRVLNEWLGTNLTVDGSYGPATEEAVKRAQKTINNSRLQNLLTAPVNGKYDEATRRAMHRYFQESAKKLKASGGGSSAVGQGVQKYETWKQLLPERMYAKGTLGTKHDEWAITDESWIGEEITLAAGKSGHLQYLKKGSSVMPADISENLVKWGKLDPNDLNSSRSTNLISSKVSESENEFNFNIDGSTQDNIQSLGKKGTDYVENLQKSVENTDVLIKDTVKGIVDCSTTAVSDLTNKNDVFEYKNTMSIKNTHSLIQDTTNSIVENSTTALETISGLTDAHKEPLDTNLTSPWISAIRKSDDFKNKAKSNVDNIIQHADLKAESTQTSLSKGFNGAQSSITAFQNKGTQAVSSVNDSFTNTETGLISALESATKKTKELKEQLEKLPKYTGMEGVGGAVAPAGGGAVSSPYGMRVHPVTGQRKFHTGIDFPAGAGTPINAYGSGEVISAGWNGGYGNCVIIDHGDGNQTLYAHASKLHVKRGDYVTQGQQIADIGSTGMSTGPHLHFEYRKNGAHANPRELTQYAKGTLGTTKDQLAITDESWIGEEITLAAGKNGQLQYLKKGSAVMPADISANLVEWGKLNPDMMGVGSMTDSINLMSSYINKPEIKVDVENFLNVGTVSRDTLPELEKLMDKKIDTFAKQLNASIRKFK